ncbi:hypothetical protein [Methyloglobulus sp.]
MSEKTPQRPIVVLQVNDYWPWLKADGRLGTLCAKYMNNLTNQ